MKNIITATYLGGPTVILEVGGLRLLTDPTLDPAGAAFPTPEKPMYWKLEGPAIQDIGHIDVVLLSHDQHGDNLDRAGRELLKRVPKILTTNIAAERLGGTAIGLSPWENIVLPTPEGDVLTITSTPARHGPAGIEPITGDVTGFLLSLSGNKPIDIYLTGDTVFYEGVREVAQKFRPQYVFIFAGAAKPRGPFNLTMGTNDALDTASAFPESKIIPVHYEGWSHYTENKEVLQQSFATLGIADQILFLPPGVPTALPG
jgi:L-ascorbate metabolism protein UlaG (beta-lactamase superfamily)